MQNIIFQPLGDTGVRVQFCEQVSSGLNKKIRSFCLLLKKERIKGVIEWVPAYDCVSVYYLPDQITYHAVCEKLSGLSSYASQDKAEQWNRIFIPTLYDGETGSDLEHVARSNQLTKEEVIEIHSGTDYLIYMMGFLPGFPYMGGLSKSICTPRLESPRLHVPAGSVGIAGEQTVIYSLQSPGGANIIGRTPVTLFDPSQENPFLFQAGDKIRFVSITEEEYEAIEQAVKNGSYKVRKEVFDDETKKH
ncbi:5-oxoprolinase subunit PxpB [Oceanobacillus sp. FSL W7-1281]|uniref:5-oxoprolinase subunit PxpB n=1 Tax=Oceanobacillus sp. FSL W7-1281 TaxID=2921698 RepID=UPI0030DBDEF5